MVTRHGAGNTEVAFVWSSNIASLTCHSPTLREESNQTNVMLQYKLLAAILSTVCSVIQQS